MLGITRKISVNEGMTLRTYSGYDVTLGDGAVPEGEVIPLSKVARKTHSEKTSLKKYRKATTAEDIQMFGTNEAVTNTDNALIRELQKKVRTDFVTSLKTEQVQKQQLPMACKCTSYSLGKLQVLFEDYGSEQAVLLQFNGCC